MGTCYSDVVEQALRYIYYEPRLGQAQKGLELLKRASEAGDGDASCILARCYSGGDYVWSGCGFYADDEKAALYRRRAVEQGSAIGILAAMRTGELTPADRKQMPFSDLSEVYNQVLAKAEAGDGYAQYAIGNVFLWGDYLELWGPEGQGASLEASIRKNGPKCEGWFQRAAKSGFYLAAHNLWFYYLKGIEGFVPPQPEKIRDVCAFWRTFAELGHPLHQYFYADELEKAGRKGEALDWYLKAAEGGQWEACYPVGRAYETGEHFPKDEVQAAQWYEKGLGSQENDGPKMGCANLLGVMYCQGRGVAQDYGRAFQLLSYTFGLGSNYGAVYLGECYFYGRGTQKDYGKAREVLEKVDWNSSDTFYMLGTIHCQGLGVPEDIKKGMEYLEKAGNQPEATAERLKYKKTLFGKWVRR